MLKATEETVLKMFEAVHGEMTGSCSAEVVYGDLFGDSFGVIIGVACVEDGQEVWIATLAELAFDITAKMFLANEAALVQ